MKLKDEQCGRSMVEILGVLAILGVLTVACIAGFSKAIAKYRVNTIKDQMTMLVSNIKTTYGKFPSYAGLENKVALEAGVVPKDMAVGTRENIIRNNFSGNVYIETRHSPKKVHEGAFRITHEGLSDEACVALATTSFDEHLVKVEFGNSEYVGEKLPLDLESAWEGCDCIGNTCTISLTYI